MRQIEPDARLMQQGEGIAAEVTIADGDVLLMVVRERLNTPEVVATFVDEVTDLFDLTVVDLDDTETT